MAKVYIRIEDRGEYRNVTTVDSEGGYCQRNAYGENDEHVLNEFRTTLTEMGWKSLAEFPEEVWRPLCDHAQRILDSGILLYK